MFLTALLTAVLTLHPQSGPRVSAQLSANQVSVGETFTYSIIVENADADVDIGFPRLPPGLELVGTQDYTESQFSIPGGRKEIRRREFALMASQAGRYHLPSMIVTIGRRRLNTNPVDFSVGGTPQPKAVGSSADAYLRAAMSPETVYVGQQSTLTVEAGFSDEVRSRLTGPPAFDTPSPNGFFVQDVPNGPQTGLRQERGGVFEVTRFQRAYFPLSAGRYAFAPARAVVDIREGFLFAPETREIRSESPKLTVLPVPTAGQPRDFKGAVGRYTVRANGEPDTVAVGEAAQITIDITGSGNIKALPQPVFPTIAGVEEFAPTEDASVSFDGSTEQGTKRFQWVIIPQRAGRINIPSISYSFFDPSSKSYRTVQTQPLMIVASATATARSDENAATLQDVRNDSRRAFSPSRRLIVSLFLLPLIVIGLILLQQKRAQRTSVAETPAAALARLRQANPPYPQFLRELDGIVRRCAGATPSADAQQLLGRIARERFAPTAAQAAERDELLRQAEALCS